MTPPKFYRPELDWLRFLAFSAVFSIHTLRTTPEGYTALGVPDLLAQIVAPLINAGSYGVDLFFALSSFLITELLLLERAHTGRVHVRSFYIRRMLRIWPLYFAFILAIAPFEVYFKDVPIAFFAGLIFFVGNWVAAATGGVESLCAPLWTVCVEEQFYIVWPNVVGRTAPKRFPIVMILVFLFACAFRVYYVENSPTPYSVWFHTFARLDAFAFGGLLAYYLHGKQLALPRLYRAAALLAAGALFWLVGSARAGMIAANPHWMFPAAALASALCIAAFVTAPPRRYDSAPLRGLSYLGKISYGLYVFHFPIVQLTKHVLPDSATGDAFTWLYRAALAAVLTLVLAAVSYEAFEKPFLRLKRRFTYVESRPT